tara:strand:- start:24 stop:209 length:186 start_codon:yes stop_codon:yes gene_type:complete
MVKKTETTSAQSGGTKPKRKLNAYFTKMLNAKKNNQKSFEHNGKTYVQSKTAKGLLVYKKK